MLLVVLGNQISVWRLRFYKFTHFGLRLLLHITQWPRVGQCVNTALPVEYFKDLLRVFIPDANMLSGIPDLELLLKAQVDDLFSLQIWGPDISSLLYISSVGGNFRTFVLLMNWLFYWLVNFWECNTLHFTQVFKDFCWFKCLLKKYWLNNVFELTELWSLATILLCIFDFMYD